MLVFDPRKRIDATQSLAHEYVAPYHDPTDEPVAGEKFDWSFNDADLPVDTWKVMMYGEILGTSTYSVIALIPAFLTKYCLQISIKWVTVLGLRLESQKAHWLVQKMVNYQTGLLSLSESTRTDIRSPLVPALALSSYSLDIFLFNTFLCNVLGAHSRDFTSFLLDLCIVTMRPSLTIHHCFHPFET